jgi:hypothetical protein
MELITECLAGLIHRARSISLEQRRAFPLLILLNSYLDIFAPVQAGLISGDDR